MKFIMKFRGVRKQALEYLDGVVAIKDAKSLLNTNKKALTKMCRFFEAHLYFLNNHAQTMVMNELEKRALAAFPEPSTSSPTKMSAVPSTPRRQCPNVKQTESYFEICKRNK